MQSFHGRAIAVIISGLSIFSVIVGCSESTNVAQDKLKFEPKVLVREPFPAIVKPENVSAEQANQSLHPEELVLGVEVNGEARAYPINMLAAPPREIINDELGGQAIAATW